MVETPMTVVVWVTHLLGTGHLFRTAAIARALGRHGVRVVVASGGMPVAGVDFADAEVVQIPAVRSPDASFRTLVDADGAEVDRRFLERRAEVLSDLLARTKPDGVLTELYPFGRRKFRIEMDRMLAEAGSMVPRPTIFASIRDIPAPPTKEDQVHFATERLHRHYDAVLVHGDPAFAPLERSYPLPVSSRHLLHYTGYIGGAAGRDWPDGASDGTGEIIVSAGGGAAGDALYRTALDAAAQPSGLQQRWRILVGRNAGEGTYHHLRDAAAANVTVEWARPDFPALLHRAAVSVSQVGYNTAADLLDAGVPSVLVPFADGGEQEQTIRAALMAEAGRAVVVPGNELTALRLASAINEALDLNPASARAIAMNGEEASADIIIRYAQRMGGRHA